MRIRFTRTGAEMVLAILLIVLGLGWIWWWGFWTVFLTGFFLGLGPHSDWGNYTFWGLYLLTWFALVFFLIRASVRGLKRKAARIAIQHDPKLTVRRGYNEISEKYRANKPEPHSNYPRWLSQVTDLLPHGARLLDLGCGNGVPVSQILLHEGYSVTGVDISEVQIQRARTLMPTGEWILGDMAEIEFSPESFDAVVSLFAIIHVPVTEQPDLFDKIRAWVKPGGYLLASVGWQAWTGTGDFYGVQMYWSHHDAETYISWLQDRGFEILNQEFFPEGNSGHTFLLAQKEG